MRDDHHLADYEIQVLLAIAGKLRRPGRQGAAFNQAIEVLRGFGYADLDTVDGIKIIRLTRDGRELAEALSKEHSS